MFCSCCEPEIFLKINRTISGLQRVQNTGIDKLLRYGLNNKTIARYQPLIQGILQSMSIAYSKKIRWRNRIKISEKSIWTRKTTKLFLEPWMKLQLRVLKAFWYSSYIHIDILMYCWRSAPQGILSFHSGNGSKIFAFQDFGDSCAMVWRNVCLGGGSTASSI